MKENPYFKEDEFKCKCGKCKLPKGVPSDELVDVRGGSREFFGKAIDVNSGYRCKEKNAKVGGSPRSQHTIGSAADFVVDKVPTKVVYHHILKKYGDFPLGIAVKNNPNNEYAGFVHLDTRGKKARWEYK